MTSRHAHQSNLGRKASRRHRDFARRKARKLHLEQLEDRRVMATGPTLIALIPNSGVPLSFTNNDVLNVAPRELLFRFSEGQMIDPDTIQQGIRIERAGFDGVFDDPNNTDVTIMPGFVGLGERPREVIMRFAENLPDDAYQVTLVATGLNPLTDLAGNPVNGGLEDVVIPFRLDLGAQIIGIVPQPVTATAGSGANRLSQDRSQVIVYFNSDRLQEASAENPAFYRLVNSTTGVVRTPEGKPGIDPVVYTYDPLTNRAQAVLQFSSNIGDGFYELRIGTNGSNESAAVTVVGPGSDSNSSFATASTVGALGLGTYQIDTFISAQPYNIVWPGAMDDPGHRDMAPSPTGESHLLGGPDGFSSASIIPYNFQDIYGFDPITGQPLHNVITENQKQRAREVFDLYSRYLGVTFRETLFGGFTIATGDPRAVEPTVPPGAVGGIAGGGVAVMNSALNWGDSEYGGGWFETAMHEIGHLLGLGHSYELPPITVQGSAENPGDTGGAPERVFPGDHDIVHGQTLFRPDSRDIDLYRFTVSQTGVFRAETLAERIDSDLNTMLWLYKEVTTPTGTTTRELISRNDDYYSEDSFLELTLEPGTYYIGVTAAGMTEVDPTIPDSGFGGRSRGAYTLTMKHTPPAQQAMVDATGTRIDGNADGRPDGVYSFWFHSNTAANTIFVDRARDTAPGVQGTGSLSNPYDTISAALTAADLQGTAANPVVVRIIGNAGADGDLATGGDATPYLVGFNDGNVALRDGGSFRVANDVTVMIDAGAVIKLQQANLDSGSTSTNVDRGRGAIQVLGTPETPVWLTAYSNDSLGGDSDGVTDGPHRGDWGGIVYRSDSDRETSGIFLNYVNHADITYGGGRVVVDSVEDIYSPVHMLNARPAVTFNTITISADAAISANPDSFDDSLGRIGPDIYGNDIRDNSINGLLVRTRATSANNALSIQTVFGRWDDTDITHVVSDNLILQGQPGGRFGGIGGNKFDARLRIDPGIFVKLDGSRIEANFSSQIIAEGTQSLPIVFTSIRDDRFGASNPFDTNNDGALQSPVPGDWGGIRFNPTAIGSIDWAKMYFGGGTVPIEGGFDSFNLIEIYQADVRIASSFLESSLDGHSTSNRAGRGNNAEAVIFVRGAQPVIVNNVFHNNEGNAISINANAMQATVQADYGRSTGRLGLTGGLFNRTDRFDDNQGPLVRLNRTGNNSTNGMEVRGGTLTTEVVWDDTDIVHVVRNEVVDLNHHVYGGLMLKSSPSESLVVKLEGDDAGITANGVPLEIDDRIGGTVQIVGQPGFPVILTSLQDCSAGAGFDTDGLLQTDTDNSGCGVQQPIANSGAVIVDGGDRDNHGDASPGPDNTIGTPDDINNDGWQFVEQMVDFAHSGARNNAPNDVLALGTLAGGAFGGALEAITSVTTVLGLNLTVATGNQISTVNFDDYKVIYVPSNEINTFGGITQAELDLLALRKTEIAQFINSGGSLVALTDSESPTPYAWLELPLPFTITDFSAGGISFPLRKTQAAINAGFTISDAELSLGAPYHNDFTGPPGFNGLVPFVLDTGDDGVPGNADDRVITLGLASGSVGIGNPPSNWRSVRLDHLSNDRNVGVVNEGESAYGEKEATLSNGVSNINGTPQKAQFLGTLGINDKNGDDNRRLGWQIHGAVQFDDTHDVDVYSFNATAGTEVWIDIDRTSYALDTIVELIDANGNVLARSQNNSILSGLALTMDKDSHLGRDTFSTNPLDAGMRVVLPVPPTGNNTPYFVRVRSTPLNPANLDDASAGATKGQYQLQIRLRQEDEQPGSVVRLSDIRFATTGIEVLGLPYHSPLLGESAEGSANNDTFATAQPLGNLLTSDRNVIGVGGNLSGPGDIDWFRFDLNYDLIQAIGGFSDGFKTFATMFDIDYGDGITRPDTTISVFDQDGALIFIGRDSDHDEDQPGAGQGADTDDLNRGSFGKLDPYIGSVQLPAGVLPSGITRTYYVAVSTNRRLPTALNATFQANAASPQIRLEPIDSITRMAEDRIGTASQSTAAPADLPLLFDASSFQSLKAHAKPFRLEDVTLFMSQVNQLFTVDAFTGALETVVDPNGLPADGNSLWDLAMRSDGILFGYEGGLPGVQNSAGRLVQLDAGNGDLSAIGNDNIPDNTNPRGIQDNSAFIVDALAWTGDSIGPVNANSMGGYALWYSIPDNPLPNQDERGLSRLYRANPASGSAAIAQGFPWGPQGLIDGEVTGTAVTDFGTSDEARLTFRGSNDLLVTFSRSAHGDASLPTVTLNGNFVNIDLNTTVLAAAAQSDFNTGGAVTLRFTADAAGDVGNNVRISVRSRDLGIGAAPEVLANVDNILITLNSNAATPTTADQLVAAVNAAPAGQLVDAAVAAGAGATTIGDRLVNYSPLQLTGGNDPSTVQDVADAVNSGPAAGLLQAFATGLVDTVVATQDPASYAQLLRVVGGAIGRTTGMTSVNNQLFGISDAGQIYEINPFGFGNFDLARNATQIELIPGENFQTGTFQTGWTGNWSVVQETAPGLPSFVAQTTPGSAAPSTLRFTATLPADGAISFEREIIDFSNPLATPPNPENGHRLSFLIDGVVQDTWIGAVADGGAAFRVPAGTHTFEWVFNPQTLIVGNPPVIFPPDSIDRAIIDNIAFGPSFSGLSHGPKNLEDGAYANTFFATTSDGALFGLSSLGIPQMIFDSNDDGVLEPLLQTSLSGVTGLAFSPLDFNLWHTTFRRQNDPGHGNEVAPDESRTSRENGERSFYFGLEEWVNVPDEPGSAYEIMPDATAGNAQMGILDNQTHIDLTNERTNPGVIGNNYNLPGGAFGTLTTDSFSLGSYKATDKPTFYFDYVLDTEERNAPDNGQMRDSARVYISADGGQTWDLIATNNSRLDNPNTFAIDGELPTFLSASVTENPNNPRQQIQELFETGEWRQARVDLSRYAGQQDLRLRFDYHTAGDTNEGLFEDVFGDFNHRERGQDNDHEGFFIDDLIIGLAERGEMVTAATADLTGVFTTPEPISHIPGEPMPAIVQSGPYQLEIRRGTEYGVNLDSLRPDIGLAYTFDSNERLMRDTRPVDTTFGWEGFERDNFTLKPWVLGGDAPWTTTREVRNLDVFSAQAGDIGDNQTSFMEFTQTTSAGYITFARRVSSQDNSDFLRFYVDGVLQDEWSGQLGFEYEAYLLPAGSHTFRWEYSKDGSSFAGLDAAWVDDIQLMTLDGFETGDLLAEEWLTGDDRNEWTTADDRRWFVTDRTSNTGGFSVQSGDISDNETSSLELARVTGQGNVTFYVRTSTEENFDFLRFYVDGVLADEWSGELPFEKVEIPVSSGRHSFRWTYEKDGSQTAGLDTVFIDDVAFPVPMRGAISPLLGRFTQVNVGALGDENFFRQQGHIQIEQNYVTNSAQVGILVDNAPRDGGGSLPYPGAARNLPTLNNPRQFAGVTVANNVVTSFGQVGIRFSGDTNPAGQTVAAVPFGRLVNNTVYGGSGPAGVGIQVSDNASPTVMNNILANTSTAISIDGTSGTTVVGANLFSNNTSNGTNGTNFIQLDPDDPLFVNPSRRNFYLADNSRAIDSSLNSLADRPTMVAVKSPLGITPSPILAPDRDALGQLRVDDPTQDPPPGLGSNIFKDRGAVERADFVGPVALLKVPADNDPMGLDQDVRETFVIYDDMFLDRFVVKFLDSGGVGIDDLLVGGARFMLTQDGVPLVQGVDYAFVYDNNADEVLFLPAAGVWPYRKTFVLTIDNSAATGIADLAGNLLQANQQDGTTRYTIFVGAPIDFGDAPDPTYPTLEASNGAGHKFIPEVFLGSGVSPDIVPLPTPGANGDDDDGLVSQSLTPGGTPSHITVVASVDGRLDAWLDINRDGDWDDANEYIISSSTPAGQLVAGSNTINLALPAADRGTSFLRLRFSTAGINTPTGLAEDGEVEDYQVELLGPPFQNPGNVLDVNADGRVSPNDAALIINALNRAIFLGVGSSIPLPHPLLAPSAPPYYDVNGTNTVTVSDLVPIINFLNEAAGPQPEGESDESALASTVSTSQAGSDLPAMLFASSSVIVESKNSGEGQTREAIDDVLFGSGEVTFDERLPIAPLELQEDEDDLVIDDEEPRSWEEAVEEFAFDIGLQ